MKKTRLNGSSEVTHKKLGPALTLEGRENQLVALAMNVAEEQMRNGTASAQVITHFLKLGTEKYEKEIDKLKRENELLQKKADALESATRSEELYEKALNSMKLYSGLGGVDEEL